MSSQDVLLVSRENSFDRLDDLLWRFWEVESCAEPIIRATKEEFDCEPHFVRHVVRLPAGDYSVRLPAKFNLDLLGESYQQAYRRFLSLEKKLNRQPALKAQYAAFIKDYLDLGHMSSVSAADIGLCRYFLPHHCVIQSFAYFLMDRRPVPQAILSTMFLWQALLFSLSCSRFFYGFVHTQ